MRRNRAFTLIELLVVVAIIALLISILLPSLSRARELSKRAVCAANERGVLQAAKLYANDHDEEWPIPGHTANTAPGSFIYQGVTGMETGDPLRSAVATTKGSPTRGLWILCRSGDVGPKQFACPSSDDTPDDAENLGAYYDFFDGKKVSYGYQIPYLTANPHPPSENAGADMAVLADNSPFSYGEKDEYRDGVFNKVSINTNEDWAAASLDTLQPFNSPNHGGAGQGEGQNVGYGDGHVEFHRRSDVGSNMDNIYTVTLNTNRTSGSETWRKGSDPAANMFPSIGDETEGWAMTGALFPDTLLYP